MACAAVCCGEVTGPGVMSYVGGGGSYTVETSYKYVGRGAGEFAYATPKRSNVMLFLTGGVVLVLLIVIIVIIMRPETTTTTPVVGPPGDCLLWGDPHVETFDKGMPSFYGEGEFWVVKSESVLIQGRYLATPFTNGLSATHQIAVGGAFVCGHKIVVGPMENGQITMDGQPILTAFPSSQTVACGGGFQLSYNGQGQLVDNAQGHLEKHIVHMQLPAGVHVQVMRWANHLNVRITMPAQPGQDGSCGNFNGNAIDDSTQAIKARIGQRVAAAELLFNHAAVVGPGGQQVTIVDCAQGKREHAMKLCKTSQPGVGAKLLETCIFDVCFAGDQYAGEDGLAESEAAPAY